MAELQLLVDNVVIKSFPLDKTVISIGRGQDNDIIIDDDSVSGNHAVIKMIPNDYLDGLIDIYIEDLNSTNGVYVNDKLVKKQQLLNKDMVRIAWTDYKLLSDKVDKLAKTSVIAR